MEQEKKKRLGAGRVAFLARKEAIKEKVEAGHTLITVYEEYQKELGIGYVQFLNYVAKFIRSKPNEGEKSAQAVETKTVKPGEKEKRKIPFVHDPKAGNSDDFIK